MANERAILMNLKKELLDRIKLDDHGLMYPRDVLVLIAEIETDLYGKELFRCQASTSEME